MVARIPSLWPKISPDIRSPVDILKDQVASLRDDYPGMFDAEVTTLTGTEDFVIHQLNLIALKPTEQRFRILIATHRTEFYPVQIEAQVYRPKTKKRMVVGLGNVLTASNEIVESLTWPPESDWRKIAHTQSQFISEIGVVLSSSEVRSAMESFIARANEADSQVVNDANGR